MARSVLQQSLSICMKVWSIFGITPYKLTSRRCKLSPRFMACTLLVLATLPAFNIYVVFFNYRPFHGIILSILTFAVMANEAVMLTIIPVLTIVNRYKIVQFCNQFLLFDSVLQCCKAQLRCSPKFKILSATYLATITVLSGICTFRISVTFWSNSIVQQVGSFLSILFLQFYMSLYSMWVMCFYVRFQAMNNYFKTKCDSYLRIKIFSLVSISNIVYPQMGMKPIRNPFTVAQEREILGTIDTVSYLYHKLWCLTNKFNVLFSRCIIFLVCHNAIWTIIYSHFFINFIARRVVRNWFHPLGIFLLNSGHILVVIYVCTLAKNEAMKTKKLLYNLRTISKHFTVRVSQFAILLQYEEVRFTAFGMFDLDGYLIASIIGTICTYIVIILQFDQILLMHFYEKQS